MRAASLSTTKTVKEIYRRTDEGVTQWSRLELPVRFDGFDGPFEFLPQGLGEKLLNGHIEFLTEHDSKTRVDIILETILVQDQTVGSVGW